MNVDKLHPLMAFMTKS